MPLKEQTQALSKTRGYFKALSQTPQWKSWAGYAFETVCLRHLSEVIEALDIPANTHVASWYSKRAQIDLLFLCPDQTTRLCEIKYREKPFKVDKLLLESFKKTEEVYKTETKTTNQIYKDLILSTELIENNYSKEISKIVTIEDLFQK